MADKHPYARYIKAYVDGDKVECRELRNINWQVVGCLDVFNLPNYEFRIVQKPILAYTQVFIHKRHVNCFETQIANLEFVKQEAHNLELTFDGGTYKLLKAEAI